MVTKNHRSEIAKTGLLLGAMACALFASVAATAGPAERYIDAQLRVVQSLEGKLDRLADIAEESAARLLAGGNIYLAGENGMVLELLGRAGGLCAAKRLALDKPLPTLSRNNIVLLSDYGAPGTLQAALEKLTPAGALVIVFASAENPLLQRPLADNLRAVPVDIPLDSRLVRPASGESLIPCAAPAIAAAEWTYIAELLGACRRHRRQLAIYLSVGLDEGRRRFNWTKGLLFEPDMQPEPVARGQYARAFLSCVGQSLEAVRSEEMERIRRAAVWLREAIAAHRQIVRNLVGHLPPSEAGIRGDVHFFTGMIALKAPQAEKWIRENLHEGDVYLLLGYQQNEDAMAATANALGALTIFLTSTAPGAEQAKSPLHLYINPHWPLTDACLELSDYDVKACPLSGILSLTCYYAICGETVGN
jgi:uncharacterized phosphosugar-binding protein